MWSGAHALAFQRWAGARIGKALAAQADAHAFPLCRTTHGAEPAALCVAGIAQPSTPTRAAGTAQAFGG